MSGGLSGEKVLPVLLRGETANSRPGRGPVGQKLLGPWQPGLRALQAQPRRQHTIQDPPPLPGRCGPGGLPPQIVLAFLSPKL